LNFKKWICATATTILLASSLSFSSVANAEETKTIADESIYDLLVDRFFNATGENDYHTDPKDISQFSGGDFQGISEKLSLITDMGFTIVSIGPIFSTEKYDGSMTTSYTELEKHFGTKEDFEQMIDSLNQRDVSVMVDFPLSNVSENHEWAKDSSKQQWIASTNDGIVQWDLNNEEVQRALIDAVVEFVTTYNVGGIRLTNLENADTNFVNNIIDEIKAVNDKIYVISNEDSDANFDASYYSDTSETFRNIYKNVDLDSSEQLKHIEPYAKGEDKPTQIMIDNIQSDRFVYDVEAFPPTRLKLSVAATLLLPGVPVMQYGTEIAMNGEAGTEAHQLYNFKTNDELIDAISNLQSLRNQSETLRNGEFKLVKNENGFLAFERISDDEHWLVVINNTGKTTRVDLSEKEIGADKEIRGMFESEIIRANDEGNYPVVLDREMVEVYQIIDERGLNVGYLVALGFVYLIFIGFIVIILKRAKRNKTAK